MTWTSGALLKPDTCSPLYCQNWTLTRVQADRKRMRKCWEQASPVPLGKMQSTGLLRGAYDWKIFGDLFRKEQIHTCAHEPPHPPTLPHTHTQKLKNSARNQCDKMRTLLKPNNSLAGSNHSEPLLLLMCQTVAAGKLWMWVSKPKVLLRGRAGPEKGGRGIRQSRGVQGARQSPPVS